MTKKKKKKRINKSRYRTKYAVGGMYTDNTVQSAGQGIVGSTSHTVFEESNPEILKQKMKFLEDTKNKLRASSQTMASTIESEEDQVGITTSYISTKSTVTDAQSEKEWQDFWRKDES